MSILVAQIGARRHYAVPRALHRLGLLELLATDLCAEGPLWRCLEATVPRPLRPQALAALLGRRVEGVPHSRITNLPLFALSPARRHRSGEPQGDHWANRNRMFCREVTRRGFGAARAVYAFNGAALEIFEAAKARGLGTILDQTSVPRRSYSSMLLEEEARWPGWEDAPLAVSSSDPLQEREEREWQLADQIVCGSQFVAGALADAGGPRERCRIVAYPGQGATPKEDFADRPKRQGALRVLFVGTLQLGKGVPYLLAAARLLRGAGIHTRLVGPSLISDAAMRELAAEVEVVGRVSRSEIAKHYAWADIFVLPTLSEGSANVVYEAMSAGLAVVTTPSAGSIVRDGRDGLIVPPREPEAIAGAILRLAQDREFQRVLAREARSSVAQYSIERYGRQLAAAYESAFDPIEVLCA